MILNNTRYRKKICVFCSLVTLVLLVLCVRLGYLMIVKGDYYSKKADELQERERELSGIRGDILDRNGSVIATNETACNISVIHNQITDMESVISVLSTELGMDEETVRKKVEKVTSIEKIKNNVSKDVGDKILSYGLGGVKVDEASVRYYPNNELFSKVIGFAGSDGQGVVALETTYDSYLKGTAGKIYTVCDGRGVEVEGYKERRQAPQKGDTLVTTLDTNIQQICQQQALMAYAQNLADSVSIIAMNPQNGEIYAMVDYPEYDLNNPFEGEDYDAIWRNSCINDTYEPGSTFKIITSAIALEEDVVDLDDRFYCPGYIVVEDRRIRCHKTVGHGSEDFRQALGNSCNPVFITLGLRLGAERYYNYMKQFGLFTKTGIDLPGEAATIMHSLDAIGQVELATMSFGQSFQITPIQMATTVSSLINGGHRVTPHFGKAVSSTDGSTKEVFSYEAGETICSEETSLTMRTLLQYVVEEGGGKKAYIEGYEIGGKTATSQTLPRSDHKYIASFVGFAPAGEPNVLVMVIIRNPSGIYYGGTIAAPVAREIFENILPYLE